MAVTNITLYVVWHLKHGGIISFYIKLKVYYRVFVVLGKSSGCFLAYF